MESKHFWIGGDFTRISEHAPAQLEQLFLNFGRDISVLTRPDIKCAYFLLDKDVIELFKLAQNICNNLNKSLIVVSLLPRYEVELQPAVISHFHTLSKAKTFEEQLESIIQQTNNIAPSNKGNIYTRLVKIDSYIEDNITQDIREEDLAKLASFSTTYFSKFFKKHKKISFQQYLSNKRVALSKVLLEQHPDEKVASIAFRVGYSDVSYFNRVFKKHTNLTPTQYRQHTN
ncbi:helix-turn-helix transcriptional regulator [Vibrio gallicus]|uniref:helix-turn-helix transcriptional regulator n=1 Tax=Vibrio gallicus TaxID=190897 RepID=UPI0021C2CE73|nr:AraC family transcriptional regulator [Vibrio gallicus]